MAVVLVAVAETAVVVSGTLPESHMRAVAFHVAVGLVLVGMTNIVGHVAAVKMRIAAVGLARSGSKADSSLSRNHGFGWHIRCPG